jgi:saccharopine dehydrogenase (NAD+, L-lysine-forming)
MMGSRAREAAWPAKGHQCPGQKEERKPDANAITEMIGIRREDKNKWERRVPIIPAQVKEFREHHGIHTAIQPSKIRIFPDSEFEAAGALVTEEISDCPVIFAIKEIPLNAIKAGRAYAFFSHTIKGQIHTMPMLKRMMELGCSLIDYERIVDEKGRRLVAFGRFAGIAGMLEGFWALGKRLSWKGVETPFNEVKHAYQYRNVEEAKAHIRTLGEEIRRKGVDASLCPFVCGFSGYGNVSRGAQEIFDCFPSVEVQPEELHDATSLPCTRGLFKTVFKEAHMVDAVDGSAFDLQDYYGKPEKYRSVFHSYVPRLTMLMNCIYWDKKYPRLLTKNYLKGLFQSGIPKLEVIGDISCDIEGSIECTVRATEPDNPVYIYDPLTLHTTDGYAGPGVVIMAVDNLPCEIPDEASRYFSNVLKPFIPAISLADYERPFNKWNVSREIKDAAILYHGEFTPKYRYMNQYL